MLLLPGVVAQWVLLLRVHWRWSRPDYSLPLSASWWVSSHPLPLGGPVPPLAGPSHHRGVLPHQCHHLQDSPPTEVCSHTSAATRGNKNEFLSRAFIIPASFYWRKKHECLKQVTCDAKYMFQIFNLWKLSYH